jgi:lyso-ornithine lipid O-acyltransferase
MSLTWQSADQPTYPRIGARGWMRAALRGVLLILLIGSGLVVLLTLRLIERPLCGARRPVTPWITQAVCRGALVILGLRSAVHGFPLKRVGAFVANHTSWLDIFALNATMPVLFVAKSEVAGWAGIGWLARATGTVFIRRDRAEVASQIATFRAMLAAGHRLVFFPEGTSTDGLQVLPFKPALFATFLDPGLAPGLRVQPVSLVYHAPKNTDPRFFGWWGTMDFAPHLLAVLARPGGGGISLIYHPPVPVAQFQDRKALALACETLVRRGVRSLRPPAPATP